MDVIARKSELEIAREWVESGRQVAIATVVSTWGSAPRKTGSHLIIDGDGRFEGSVSGGCVEGAVIAEALEIIESGEPKLLSFGVDDAMAWEAGLACGGTIEVYVERVD